MSTQVGHWLRRAACAARSVCSLRYAVAIPAGALLALLPLASGLSTNASIPLVPNLPRYAHQGYAYALAGTRIQADPAARAWLAAADRALLQAEAVTLPYAGERQVAGNDAVGLAFDVPEARKLSVAVELGTDLGAGKWFVDLFRAVDGRYERVAGSPPRAAGEPFELDVIDAGTYLLRAQSELSTAAIYRLRLDTTALLAFPVEGQDGRAIWSGFGAERDGGRRAHRGVDIFAKRGTPALAAMDAWVARVESTRVGGNVVWLQPLFGNVRLYYAHLDEQWVSVGDFVTTGQPLGAVGNTGNAVTTPPHLHFGVYVRQRGVRGGARDPAVFLR